MPAKSSKRLVLKVGSSVESTEFSSGTRDQHVAAFGGMEMRPTTDVGDRRANVPEVCRAVPRIQSKAVAATLYSIR